MAWMYSNRFFNRCDIVTVNGLSSKKELKKHQCKAPMKIIPLSITLGQFDTKKSPAVRKKYGKGPLILYVGRIAHEKNMP
ncbi:MAG: hypothetical protein ABIH34_07190, partial [Nanoarchaeota archaeon]